MQHEVTGQFRGRRREWYRDLEDKKIAGVCGGLSSQLGIPVTAVRAVFVLLALPSFSAVGIVLYLVLWFLMPASPDEPSGLDRVLESVVSLGGASRLDRPDFDEDLSSDRWQTERDMQ